MGDVNQGGPGAVDHNAPWAVAEGIQGVIQHEGPVVCWGRVVHKKGRTSSSPLGTEKWEGEWRDSLVQGK